MSHKSRRIHKLEHDYGGADALVPADLGEHGVAEKDASGSVATPTEGTNILSTGETGGNKYLRENSDDSSSWQAPPEADVVFDNTGGHKHTGADSTKVAHDDTTGIDANNHHDESHTVASHSDTTATGAELDELTGGSVTDLHDHPREYDSSLGESISTNSPGTGGYTDKVTITETLLAGDYKIEYSCAVASQEVKKLYTQLDVDATVYGLDESAMSNVYPAFKIRSKWVIVTLTEASHTIKLQWAGENSGKNHYIKDAYLILTKIG